MGTKQTITRTNLIKTLKQIYDVATGLKYKIYVDMSDNDKYKVAKATVVEIEMLVEDILI